MDVVQCLSLHHRAESQPDRKGRLRPDWRERRPPWRRLIRNHGERPLVQRRRSGGNVSPGWDILRPKAARRIPPANRFGGEAAQFRPMRKHQTRLDDSVARLLPKGFRGFRRLSTSLVGRPTPLGRACCGGSSGAHPAQGARAGADRLSSAAPAVSLRAGDAEMDQFFNDLQSILEDTNTWWNKQRDDETPASSTKP